MTFGSYTLRAELKRSHRVFI